MQERSSLFHKPPSSPAYRTLTFFLQSEHVTKLKEELAAPLRTMQEIARRIAKVAKESKLPMDEDEYVQSFKVELMDAVVQWCRGASFADICKVSTVLANSVNVSELIIFLNQL